MLISMSSSVNVALNRYRFPSCNLANVPCSGYSSWQVCKGCPLARSIWYIFSFLLPLCHVPSASKAYFPVSANK